MHWSNLFARQPQDEGVVSDNSAERHEQASLEMAKALVKFEEFCPITEIEPDFATVDLIEKTVQKLNEQMELTATLMTNTTIKKVAPTTSEITEARKYIGSQLGAGFLDFLDAGVGEWQLPVLRVALLTSLVHRCGHIVNKWVYLDDTRDLALESAFVDLITKVSPRTSGRWKALVKLSIKDIRHELDEAGQPTKLLDHVFDHMQCIMVVMGYSLRSAIVHITRHEEHIARCVETALLVKSLTDRLEVPNLFVPWPEISDVFSDKNERVDIWLKKDDRGGETILCATALGLYDWYYDDPEGIVKVQTFLKPKAISVSVLEDTKHPMKDSMAFRNNLPRRTPIIICDEKPNVNPTDDD